MNQVIVAYSVTSLMDMIKYFDHTNQTKEIRSVLGITFGPYILSFSMIQFVFYFNKKENI